MKRDDDIKQALDGTLSSEQWRELLKDTDARVELESQLQMDAMLRVALEHKTTTKVLHGAILATVKASSTETLQGSIEAATIGHRMARRRLGGTTWRSLPRWTTAAAAVLIGGMIGSLAWPELVLRFDLGPDIVARTGKPFRIHGQLIADVPATDTAPVVPVIAPPVIQAVPEPAKQIVQTVEPAPSPVMQAPKPAVVETKTAPLPKVTEAPKVIKPPPPAIIEATVPAMTLAAKVAGGTPTETSVTTKVDFEKQVLPLLERSCFECHSSKQKKPKGDVRFDDLEAIREKSRTDNLLFPHKPDKSALVKSISRAPDHDDVMPPKDEGTPMSTEEIALIRRWVEEGANFGTWTSMRAREVQVSTQNEAVDAAQALVTARRIDQLIEQDLAKNGQEPQPMASENVWLRRVYLDLIGRIPTVAEVTRFRKAAQPDKRARLVDELLDSNGHVSHMFNYWCDLLRAKDELAEGVKGDFYLAWIKQSIRDNKPYDQWARELISPEGYGWRAPAAGYYLRDGENRAANIESTTTLFLGTQISCAQCHDHPYDRWTRKDYHQFMAWTSGIKTATESSSVGQVQGKEIQEAAERYDRMAMNRLDPERRAKYKRISDAIEALQRAAGGAGVVNGEGAPAVLPGDYQYSDGKAGDALPAAVLYGTSPATTARPADTLAEWITAADNTRFHLTLANRLWAKIFGLPFAGRVDQVREIANCDNPDLAQYLVHVVQASKHDVRQILRIYCLTNAYQREASSPPQEAGVAYRFPGPVVRRLTSEQVWDSMMSLAVTDLDAKLNFDPPGVAELETAVGATKASEVTGVARKMAAEEEREMKTDERRARLRKDMAEEFAGGGLERASELPQPTPPGHFLRMFGQGNRDFIGDAWSASTVPQALLMLNSDFFDHVARSGSPLAGSLRNVNNARDVARGAFLAVLTREPTKDELDSCIETLGEARNPKTLARTLLSTAEFVFQK